MPRNKKILSSLTKENNHLINKQLSDLENEINTCLENLYSDALAISENSKTRRFHIISKFVLGSNGDTSRGLVFADDKVVFADISSASEFMATNLENTNIVQPWSLAVESFFGLLEDYAAEVMKEMATTSAISFNYESFKSYEQRFAVVVCIYLAYYRAQLARNFNKTNIQETDANIVQNLAQTLFIWLTSGRIWFLDIKTKKINLPITANISLSHFDYKGDDKFYFLPYSTGYIAYSTTINSPFLWSFLSNNNVFTNNLKDFKQKLDETLELNESLATSVDDLHESLINYQKNSHPYGSAINKNILSKTMKEIINDSRYWHLKNHKDLSALKELSKVGVDVTSSVFGRIKNNADLVEINFTNTKMIIFNSSEDYLEIETKEYSKEYLQDLQQNLQVFYTENNNYFLSK